MSIITNIITESRALAGVDIANVSDAQAIIFADDCYQELVDIKKATGESFLHKQGFINFSPYKNDYSLPSDFDKMELLSALYTTPTYTAWAASTVYAAGDKCTYGGKAWICTTAHTSSSNFYYTSTYTTSAIMVAGETVTINGVTFTAKAAGAATSAGDFAIGGDEATCLANLKLCIESATAGTAATFIALSEYNKSLLTDVELVVTNPTSHTIVITSTSSITNTDTSTVGSWSTETGGNWLHIYEGYVNVVPMKVDYYNMDRYNSYSEDGPVYFFLEDKIKVFPYPTESVYDGLKLDYIQKLTTLTTTTDDNQLYIEDKFYKAWKYGVAYKMQEYCMLDSGLMRNNYEIEKSKCQTRWANRHKNKRTEILPNLSNYMRNNGY